MPLLVRPCHHHRFRAVLNDSFRLRREVFEAGAAAGGLECDPFDGNAAFYLVNLDPAGRVIATVRATPDSAGWADAAIPRGPGVVELARLCADPRLPGEERRRTLEALRAGLALLFLRHGWTQAVVIGHDRHIQPFIRSGMTTRPLGPPALLPGDSRLTLSVMASDPDRHRWAAEFMAGRLARLQDPDEDPSLFTRYGDRAVA